MEGGHLFPIQRAFENVGPAKLASMGFFEAVGKGKNGGVFYAIREGAGSLQSDCYNSCVGFAVYEKTQDGTPRGLLAHCWDPTTFADVKAALGDFFSPRHQSREGGSTGRKAYAWAGKANPGKLEHEISAVTAAHVVPALMSFGLPVEWLGSGEKAVFSVGTAAAPPVLTRGGSAKPKPTTRRSASGLATGP
jgi:hypothetical protein